MPFLQINTIPRPSHSTQSPPAHAHSTATCSCTHSTATCSCTHLLYAAFMNLPIFYQPEHQGCPAITTALLHPAASTRKLECPPLLLAPLPRSGTCLRRSSICSATTSISFLQLPTTAAPSSFTQLPLLLEVRMSTPYCWHHSLAPSRVRLRRSSIRSTTLHVSYSDHSFKTCS